MKTLGLIGTVLLMSFQSYSQWVMIWNDEFDNSTLDNTKWVNDVGGNGWGNNEAQFYTAGNANLTIANGEATFTAKDEQFGTNEYTSAKIISKNLFDIQYGKIEGRMKCPMGKGLWPAFWMLGNSIDTVSWPMCGEIDVMEHINSETKIHGTAHWDNVGHQYLGGIINTNPADFHTYTITWDSTYIKWYMDDQLYYLLNITNGTNGTEEFHKKFYLILNLAVGGNWPGYPDATTQFPADFVVDYIRVYKDQAELTVNEINQNAVTVYPNPAEDLLTIKGLTEETALTYAIYSLNGDQLVQQELDLSNTIDIKQLASGMYMLQLTFPDGFSKQISITKK
jgi:beta-glucanase (GH16 family)